MKLSATLDFWILWENLTKKMFERCIILNSIVQWFLGQKSIYSRVTPHIQITSLWPVSWSICLFLVSCWIFFSLVNYIFSFWSVYFNRMWSPHHICTVPEDSLPGLHAVSDNALVKHSAYSSGLRCTVRTTVCTRCKNFRSIIMEKTLFTYLWYSSIILCPIGI